MPNLCIVHTWPLAGPGAWLLAEPQFCAGLCLPKSSENHPASLLPPTTERDGYDINSPFTHWVLLSGRECRLNATVSLPPCSENEGKTLGRGHSTGSLIPFCV